jgi:hypothetical protein
LELLGLAVLRDDRFPVVTGGGFETSALSCELTHALSASLEQFQAYVTALDSHEMLLWHQVSPN